MKLDKCDKTMCVVAIPFIFGAIIGSFWLWGWFHQILHNKFGP